MHLRFPPRNEALEYADWVADLYQADAYYVSQARYVLGRVPVTLETKTLEKLEHDFEEAVARGDFAPDATIEAYRTRLMSLETLIRAITEDPSMKGAWWRRCSRLAPEAAPALERGGIDFIVYPNGDAVIVPEGASGPIPAKAVRGSSSQVVVAVTV
jgi:hypothetical protein